jgi:hypothetical protein
MYVIWNTTRRAYVARPGSAKSFTRNLQKARTFASLAAARSDCCGDERPVSVADAML